MTENRNKTQFERNAEELKRITAPGAPREIIPTDLLQKDHFRATPLRPLPMRGPT